MRRVLPSTPGQLRRTPGFRLREWKASNRSRRLEHARSWSVVWTQDRDRGPSFALRHRARRQFSVPEARGGRMAQNATGTAGAEGRTLVLT